MPILVGTASWTDKSLIDSRKFYPPGAKDAQTRLRYYATQFPMVEVDSSYYAMPVAHAAYTITDLGTPNGDISIGTEALTMWVRSPA